MVKESCMLVQAPLDCINTLLEGIKKLRLNINLFKLQRTHCGNEVKMGDSHQSNGRRIYVLFAFRIVCESVTLRSLYLWQWQWALSKRLCNHHCNLFSKHYAFYLLNANKHRRSAHVYAIFCVNSYKLCAHNAHTNKIGGKRGREREKKKMNFTEELATRITRCAQVRVSSAISSRTISCW